jgi:hypothetical protein
MKYFPSIGVFDVGWVTRFLNHGICGHIIPTAIMGIGKEFFPGIA